MECIEGEICRIQTGMMAPPLKMILGCCILHSQGRRSRDEGEYMEGMKPLQLVVSSEDPLQFVQSKSCREPPRRFSIFSPRRNFPGRLCRNQRISGYSTGTAELSVPGSWAASHILDIGLFIEDEEIGIELEYR